MLLGCINKTARGYGERSEEGCSLPIASSSEPLALHLQKFGEVGRISGEIGQTGGAESIPCPVEPPHAVGAVGAEAPRLVRPHGDHRRPPTISGRRASWLC